jgi:hypothetical protein
MIPHLLMEDILLLCKLYCLFRTRLVEAAVRGGWRTIQKALKMLPG